MYIYIILIILIVLLYFYYFQKYEHFTNNIGWFTKKINNTKTYGNNIYYPKYKKKNLNKTDLWWNWGNNYENSTPSPFWWNNPYWGETNWVGGKLN